MVRRLLIAVVGILASLVGLHRLARSRTYQLFGEIVSRVETTKPVVALTFDDGPSREHAPEVLAVLRERGVKATFFVLGAEVDRDPDLARRIVAEGHELGNHTYRHARMVLKSASFVRDEIERTDTAIRRAGHQGPILFRPPYCWKLVGLPLYMSRTGRTTLTWDLEPDSAERRADELVAHVLERARPGSIVLLHVMYGANQESRKAIAPTIDGLRARGFAFATASELLRLR